MSSNLVWYYVLLHLVALPLLWRWRGFASGRVRWGLVLLLVLLSVAQVQQQWRYGSGVTRLAGSAPLGTHGQRLRVLYLNSRGADAGGTPAALISERQPEILFWFNGGAAARAWVKDRGPLGHCATNGVATSGIAKDPTDGIPTDGIPTDGISTGGISTDGIDPAQLLICSVYPLVPEAGTNAGLFLPPSLITKLQLPSGEGLGVALAQAASPFSLEGYRVNRVLIRRLATFFRSESGPWILALDLRSNESSQLYRFLRRSTALHSVFPGWLSPATWKAGCGLLRFSPNHLLYQGRDLVRVLSFRLLRLSGGNHQPFEADISVRSNS